MESDLLQVQFNAEDQLQRSYRVTATADPARLTLQDEGLSNALAGSPAEHKFTVQQDVPALALTARAVQDNTETYVISQAAGVVSLSVTELNDTAATYSWTSTELTLQTSGATASFDPTAVAEGRYTVTATAQSASGHTGRYDLALRVISECPVENCTGAGSSGIPAEQNKVAQTPYRLPLCPNVSTDNRVESCQVEGSNALFLEVPNQYQLTLGALAEEQSWSTGQFGVALNDALLNDTDFVQQGLIINFDVLGLDNPGEVVPVAIPLTAGTTIPANAIWRKFINSQWQNFVVNEANRIDSAASDAAGLCPGVSSDKWSTGLSAGHSCVRLTIEDGGPNDDDGVANSVIRDPGVLAVAAEIVPTPQPEPPQEDNRSGGGLGSMALLLLAWVVWARLRRSAGPAPCEESLNFEQRTRPVFARRTVIQ